MPQRGSWLWSAASEPPAARKDHRHHIESLNYQLRRIIKNRGHFPSDEAVIKPLCISEISLAVPDVSALTTTVTPSRNPIAVTSSCQAARRR
jgi:hypothetical protein